MRRYCADHDVQWDGNEGCWVCGSPGAADLSSLSEPFPRWAVGAMTWHGELAETKGTPLK